MEIQTGSCSDRTRAQLREVRRAGGLVGRESPWKSRRGLGLLCPQKGLGLRCQQGSLGRAGLGGFGNFSTGWMSLHSLGRGYALLWRTWLHLLYNLLLDTRGLWLGPPEAFPSPGWASPASSSAPHTARAPVPNQFGGSPLNSLQSIHVRAPNWMRFFSCGFMSAV